MEDTEFAFRNAWGDDSSTTCACSIARVVEGPGSSSIYGCGVVLPVPEGEGRMGAELGLVGVQVTV